MSTPSRSRVSRSTTRTPAAPAPVVTPSTRDDRPGEGGDVPVGWFAVEQAAEILITSAGKAMSAATFQFRATRDVLALTLLLAGFTDPIVDLPRRQLRLVRDLLSVDQRWQLWC